MKSILAIILIGFICSGCATALSRAYIASGYSDSLGIYPATKMDTEALMYFPQAWKEESKLECLFECPFILLDYPFSLTFDTLFLPFDLYRK